MTLRTLCVLAVALAPSWAFAQETDSESTKAFKMVHETMMKEMQGMKHTGDPDKDFAMMMIPHHQGAIDMAKVELQFGKDSMLRAMAEKIIKDQEKEITDLKHWQTEHAK